MSSLKKKTSLFYCKCLGIATVSFLSYQPDLIAQNVYPTSGNVGIGTTVPGYPLDVQTTNYWAARFKNSAVTGDRTVLVDLQNGDATPTTWRLSVGGTGNGLGINDGQFYLERAGLRPSMTISKWGNVGIGVENPGYVLDVAGRARFRSGNGTAGFWLNNTANTAERSFYGMANDNLVGIYGSGGCGWGMVMDVNNGSVAIGSTNANPAYKLSVNGSIRAKEVVVESGWADFVFENDYKLMPLVEVENYIKNNKHLPNVPSALEVKENGVKVGEIEATLLQKIEELTLYAIESKKQVDALQNKIKVLETSNVK